MTEKRKYYLPISLASGWVERMQVTCLLCATYYAVLIVKVKTVAQSVSYLSISSLPFRTPMPSAAIA